MYFQQPSRAAQKFFYLMIVDKSFGAFLPVVYVSQPSAFWPMSDWSLWFSLTQQTNNWLVELCQPSYTVECGDFVFLKNHLKICMYVSVYYVVHKCVMVINIWEMPRIYKYDALNVPNLLPHGPIFWFYFVDYLKVTMHQVRYLLQSI